jgi:TonB family protein
MSLNRAVLLFGLCILAGCAGGSSSGGGGASPALSGQISLYSHQLHDRFYQAWNPPERVGVSLGKVSVPVDVRIDSQGHVLQFKIVRSSGNERIDRSIRDVGKRITQVAPPPLGGSNHYFNLRIYFELDVES